MEMICFRVDEKVKHEFRMNCMRNKRSMQFILDKLVNQFNAKYEQQDKKKAEKDA